MLDLGGTLGIAVRKAKQVIRQVVRDSVRSIQPGGVGIGAAVLVIAVDVVIQGLVELLVTNVDTELQCMGTKLLADVVGPGIAIPNLWQLAFEVVADGERTRHNDKWNTFVILAEAGCNSCAGVARVAEALAGRNIAAARILYEIGIDRLLEAHLVLTHPREMGLVHQAVVDGPDVRHVQLLDVRRLVGAEAGNVGAGSLEERERLIRQ